MNKNYSIITFAVLKNFDSTSSRFMWEEKKMRYEFTDVYDYLDKVKDEYTTKKVKQETIEKILLLLDR